MSEIEPMYSAHEESITVRRGAQTKFDAAVERIAAPAPATKKNKLVITRRGKIAAVAASVTLLMSGAKAMDVVIGGPNGPEMEYNATQNLGRAPEFQVNNDAQIAEINMNAGEEINRTNEIMSQEELQSLIESAPPAGSDKWYHHPVN